MQRSIALFDIDNTMYDGFSYFALLEKHVNEQLISAQVLDTANKIMQKYRLKQQDYETTIVELLDIYAKGLKNVAYQPVLRSTLEFYRNSTKFFAYVEPTIEALRSTHDITLVTGEPQFVAQAVAKVFDIETYYSSEYEVQHGVFTGKVSRYLGSRHEKHNAITHLTKEYNFKDSLAFGDSEGDIEMLQVVQHAICLNPTPGLQALAKENRWHLPKINDVQQLVRRLLSK